MVFTGIADAAVEINWWHSMSGARKEVLDKIVNMYNTSQRAYKINAVVKGNYTESLNAAIAAYRGKKHTPFSTSL